MALTLEDIVDTYGKPVFIWYFLAAPAAVVSPSKVSAFDRMMAASKELHLPDVPARGINKKLDLKADIVQWLKKQNVGWRIERLESHGAPFVIFLCDVFWYVDPHQATMKDRDCEARQSYYSSSWDTTSQPSTAILRRSCHALL